MRPEISIGLPVYNGERYLEEAVQSVLDQDFTDFELIIRDNASTDGTQSICERFAKEDDRVRYIRNPSNVGAAPNFNALVDDARGQYFQWMAHDDLLLPQFLSECLEALQREPDAVLACPTVTVIDSQGSVVEDEYVSPFRMDDPDRAVRFGEMLNDAQRCYEIFGLIRLSELRRTDLIAAYHNGDGVLLAHLSLLGKFASVPRSLFLSRRHEEQSSVLATRDGNYIEDYASWFDPKNSTSVSFSFHRSLKDYVLMVARTPMSHRERSACYAHLSRWTLRKWRFLAGEWKRSAITLVATQSAEARGQSRV